MDNKINVLGDDVTVDDFIIQTTDKRNTTGIDDGFYVCNLGTVYQQHLNWCQKLPRVRPFYAVKCHNDQTILQFLSQLGVGFDCASKNEIKAVLELGVSPDRIIYANPCKRLSHLRFAAKHGVTLVTFDNADELTKIKQIMPNAKMVLRVQTKQFAAEYPLSDKFGCPLADCEDLLKKAKTLNLNVTGACFHVGSNCQSKDAFHASIAEARQVFDQAEALGFEMKLLDIGGGYPGLENSAVTLKQMSDDINAALNLHFPIESGVDVIAEPGRYYVEACCTLVLNVVGKNSNIKEQTQQMNGFTDQVQNDKQFSYFINDSAYGAFLVTVLMADDPEIQARPLNSADTNKLYPSVLWGDTCCGIDKITMAPIQLPELQIGDWLVFDNMGAYTTCMYTGFNGMTPPDRLYVIDEVSMVKARADSVEPVPDGILCN